MLVILLIGWTILLPAIVVAGLYVGSSVLSRRRAALNSPYEDLLLDEDPLREEDPSVPIGEADQGGTSIAPAGPAHSAVTPPPAPSSPATSDRPSVGAGY